MVNKSKLLNSIFAAASVAAIFSPNAAHAENTSKALSAILSAGGAASAEVNFARLVSGLSAEQKGVLTTVLRSNGTVKALLGADASGASSLDEIIGLASRRSTPASADAISKVILNTKAALASGAPLTDAQIGALADGHQINLASAKPVLTAGSVAATSKASAASAVTIAPTNTADHARIWSTFTNQCNLPAGKVGECANLNADSRDMFVSFGSMVIGKDAASCFVQDHSKDYDTTFIPGSNATRVALAVVGAGGATWATVKNNPDVAFKAEAVRKAMVIGGVKVMGILYPAMTKKEALCRLGSGLFGFNGACANFVPPAGGLGVTEQDCQPLVAGQ